MTDRRADSSGGRPRIDPRSHRQALIRAIRERCSAEDRPLQAVAREAGLQPARLAAAQAGEVDLRLDEMTAISNVLGVKASELIARAEAMSREAP
ncbi:MAG TPA: hypothetical protein VI111_00825 [Thermoleophilaceae bacterium]